MANSSDEQILAAFDEEVEIDMLVRRVGWLESDSDLARGLRQAKQHFLKQRPRHTVPGDDLIGWDETDEVAE